MHWKEELDKSMTGGMRFTNVKEVEEGVGRWLTSVRLQGKTIPNSMGKTNIF